MPNILDLLKQILSSRYGKDVRQSIHDAIYQCYKDGKAGSIDVDAREQLDEVKTHLDTVEAIAKGKTSALAYETYADMISSFNSMDNESMKRGWNIYIATLNVPDLWIYKVEETASEYTYVDDETFTNALKTDAVVQIGYYKVAALETGKVDLTEYVKGEDIEERLAEIEGDVSELYRNYDSLSKEVDGKQTSITGGATTITSSNLTANRALISDASGKVTVSGITSAQLGHLSGVSANVQGQLNILKTTYSNILSTTTTIAHGGGLCHITLPAGTYILGGYTSTVAWLNGITDTNNKFYAKLDDYSGFMRIITITANTQFYYVNQSGSAYPYTAGTCLCAHRIA